MESQKNLHSKASTTKPSIGYQIYQFSRTVVGVSFLFWLTYTVAYQFIDGWHFSAVSQSEKALDDIVYSIWFFFVFIMFTIWCFKLDRMMDDTKCC
jgi:hypothetical protein